MTMKRPEVVGPDGENPFKLNFDFKFPGKAGMIGIAALLVVAVLVIGWKTCFAYIQPNELGIKQVNIGIFKSKGIQETIYGPGLVFRIPFCEVIHRFPHNLQVLELTSTPGGRGNASHRYGPTAKIQTSDGFYVDVDVSILYRITDPYKVINILGPNDQYYDVGIVPNVEPKLKEALGALTTEEFYNSPLRVEKADIARDLLNKELEAKGMKIEHVFVRYFLYQREIQKNIEEKKLQDQLAFRNQAEGLAAIEGAKLKKVTQEGEMNVRVTLQEGKAYKTKKDAERDLLVRKKRAEADLLVQLAEAKKTELKNEAYRTVGVEKAVAMKMAEVMRGLDVIVVTTGGPNGFNPLDLDQMVELFGANSAVTDAAKGKSSRAAPRSFVDGKEVAQ